MRLWNLRSRHLAHEDWPVRCWSDGGPDTVDNAFSLRSLTRVLIDKGALGASSDYEVKVSRRFTGRITSAKATVLDLGRRYFAGAPGRRTTHSVHTTSWPRIGHTDVVGVAELRRSFERREWRCARLRRTRVTNTERILTALLTHGPMSDSELRRQTGVEPHQQVNQICRRLAQQGRVRRAPGPDGLILNQLMDEPAMPAAMQATASSSRQLSVQRCSVAHPAPVEPVALSDERTLLLLPCSGAKAAGGRPVLAGPSVSDYLDDELAASLRSARSEVAAVAAVDERLVLPACQRYTGTLYRSAAPVLANEQAIRRVAILSGGYGLVLAGEPIGTYDRRFATGDWPRGLLERCLVALASGLAVDQVVALCARSTGYAELVRRAPWKRAGIEAVLVAPEMQGGGGAQVLVPRAAGEALAAMAQGSLPLAWQSTDGVGVQMERLA